MLALKDSMLSNKSVMRLWVDKAILSQGRGTRTLLNMHFHAAMPPHHMVVVEVWDMLHALVCMN